MNHFLPVTKLVSKVRLGSRVKNIYDAPKTPYQRILDSEQVGVQAKRTLRAIHAKLDIVQLRHQMDEILDKLRPSKAW